MVGAFQLDRVDARERRKRLRKLVRRLDQAGYTGDGRVDISLRLGTLGAHLGRGAVADARVVVGTDIGIVRLTRPTPPVPLPSIASAVSPVPSRTVTYGFGGTTKRSAPPRNGRILAKVPFAVSLNLRTRVRHAAICVPTERDQVVYGDSGGPVLVAGEVTVLQSLLFGYRHRELLNIATVALLPPHLTALSRAMDIMSVR